MDISRYDFTENEITDMQITSGPLINEIAIAFAYDHMDGTPQASITKHNPLSKRIYGDARVTRDLKMIQGTRQAEKYVDAVLMTSSIPEIIVSFTAIGLRSMLCEVGDMVTITHRAGVGGFQAAKAIITKITGTEVLKYVVSLKPAGSLYQSELINLSRTTRAQSAAGVESSGGSGISISGKNGVYTLTLCTQEQAAIEGAEVTINGVTKVTDKKGQVSFKLLPGSYVARIRAAGYEDADFPFKA